jgi:hypothetical protein
VGEKRNVAAQHPEVVAHLKQLHEGWVKAVGGKGRGAAEGDP